MGARFSVVVSEAHYVEALLCCRAETRDGRLVRVASERRDGIVHRVASDYRSAVRSLGDEIVINWPRIVRGFLETLEQRGEISVVREFLDQLQGAARQSALRDWELLRDDPTHFDAATWRFG